MYLRSYEADESEDDEDECGCCTTEKVSNCLKRLKPGGDSIFCEFLRASTIQGFKYVGQEGKHGIQRVFWICTITGALMLSGFLIRIGVVMPLIGNPVFISFHSSDITIDQIPFPAFTICNVNQIKKSELEKLERVVDEYVEYVESNRTSEYLENFGESPTLEIDALKIFATICTSAMKSFLRKCGYSSPGYVGKPGVEASFNSTVHTPVNHEVGVTENIRQIAFKYLAKAQPNCSEMIVRCLWRNKEFSCRELFSPVRTRLGRCCVFNMMPQFIMRGYSADDPRVDWDERHLNKSVVDAWRNWNIDENLIDDSNKKRNIREYPQHQEKAGMWTGLSILVNPQLSEYKCAQGDSKGFRVHSSLALPHVENFGSAIGPNEEVLVGVTASVITGRPQDIKSYSFRKRQCYFLGEKVLNTFKFYRKENCIDECVASETWMTCGCVLIDQPREGNRSYCVTDDKIHCAVARIQQLRRGGIREKCKACLPSCTNVEYTSDLSRMPMRNDVRLWRKRHSDSDELWANESLSIIHVFFESDYVESFIRKSLSGYKMILADAGGLLGLAIGLSLISFVEPVYFFTLRRYFEKRRKNR